MRTLGEYSARASIGGGPGGGGALAVGGGCDPSVMAEFGVGAFEAELARPADGGGA